MQPTAVAVLSTSLCSDAGAVVWACECACRGCVYALMLELLFGHAGCRVHYCALMLELLFGHVSMPAWGAECSAVLAVWACECAGSDAGAVLAVDVPAWGVNCLHVL